MMSDFAQWLWKAFQDFAVWLLDEILSGLAAVLEAIPVPDWAQGTEALFAAVPCEITYFLVPFRVAEGLAIIGAALLTAFLIRRLPFIG